MKLGQSENRKKYLWETEKKGENRTNEKKSIIRIDTGQGNNKQEKKEERQSPHQRQLVFKPSEDLQKIRKIISEKYYYHDYITKPSVLTYISSRSILRENQGKSTYYNYMRGFNYNVNMKEWIKKRRKKNFQNADKISENRKSNTVSLALSRKEDEEVLHDTYSVEKESDKKENKQEEGEINSETEMDKISEGNDVGEVETDEEVKEKKNKAL